MTNVVQERMQNRLFSSFAEPKPTLAMYFLITAQRYKKKLRSTNDLPTFFHTMKKIFLALRVTVVTVQNRVFST